MIKGCTKRVVVVRDIESNFFEEAFFIVKPGSTKRVTREADFINEANRIVKSDLPKENAGSTFTVPGTLLPAFTDKDKNKPKLRDVLMFVFGFGVSAVFCTFIYYSGILL